MESTRKIQGRFSLPRKWAATQFRSKISQCSPSGFILGPCTDARRVLDPTTQIEEAESNRWCGYSWVNKHASFVFFRFNPKLSWNFIDWPVSRGRGRQPLID